VFEVVGVIVFADLNLDSSPEIIAVNDIGEVHVLNLDGSYYQNFPINYQFPFSSAPLIYDVDRDGDLEIIAGTTNAIISIDIKESGSAEDYWSIFGNGYNRNSLFEYNRNCLLGDINQDMQINVVDIISIVNIILESNYNILGDVNQDNNLNVSDIVMLINIILGD
jgi:hypothetical protein